MERKHLLFVVGACAVALILLIQFLDESYGGVCNINLDHGANIPLCEIVSLSILPLALLVPFGIVFLFFQKKEILDFWLNFSVWFLPLMMISIFLMYWKAESGTSGAWGISSGIGEFVISFLLYAVFVSVSITRILIAWYQTKKEKKLSSVASFILGVIVLLITIGLPWFIASLM